MSAAFCQSSAAVQSAFVPNTLRRPTIHSLSFNPQWNSKITTPPGLYLFTMGVFKPFKELYAFGRESADEICPLYLARFSNFIFGTANFFLVYLIQSNLNSKYLVSLSNFFARSTIHSIPKRRSPSP